MAAEVQMFYNVEQVIDVVEKLSHSQGFYERLLEEIMCIKKQEPEKFEVFKDIIEQQKFQNAVDIVMFFEQ